MRPRIDITGQRFGALVAIRDAGGPMKSGGGGRPWLCRCDCGKSKIIALSSLRWGLSHSCGHMARFKRSSGLSLFGDDDLLEADILFDLENEFGMSAMPEPRGPVFHQSLSSDAELGVYARVS